MTESKAGSAKSKKENAGATCDVSEVIEKEREYLGLDKQETVSGFAISGGGIRSASFGLGVMQALVANDQFEKIDYMSTVSGGGYLGSALTWALHQGKGEAGTNKENFPLGKRKMFAGQDKDNAKMEPDYKNNGLLDYIRQHSSYLMPTSGLGVFSFAGVVLRSILLSLSVYFGVILTAMILLRQFHLFTIKLSFSPFEGIFIPISILALLIFLAKCLLYSFATSLDRDRLNDYMLSIHSQKVTGALLTISIISILIGLLPVIEVLTGKGMSSIMSASGSTLFGTLVGIWQYVKAQKNDKSSGMLSDAVIYIAAFALMYGLLLLAYIGAGHFFNHCEGTLLLPYFIVLICVTFVFGFFVNLNLIGPHRIWRDRLMEAFMPDSDAVTNNKWMPAKGADSALMKNMCNDKNKRPYHIINTNIILANSRQVKFRGRGGDNFIISPRYCGSEATGWKETAKVNNGERGITLATAMATSAAALNPDAGVSGAGPTRNVIVSVLLSMLNLRLGYWTGNPRKNVWSFPPNFFVPGLSTEIFRLGFKETDTRILLSDGGHFENLALYELIRRKLNLIIISDGGADGIFNFDDLANAVEKVRVDFGAKIVFGERGKKKGETKEKEDPVKDGVDIKEIYGLNDILFDADGRNAFQKKYEIAKRGFAIATITYNDETEGTLVYLKLAMIDELSTDVYSYKGMNPTFPHQSTADQFFDEKQFEAYRELGYTVAWKMMESKEGREIFS